MKTEDTFSIVKVDAEGVDVTIASNRRRLSWRTLKASAEQDDPIKCYYNGVGVPPQDAETKSLAEFYRRLRKAAHDRVASDGEVTVTWGQNQTNVWWVASATSYDDVDVSHLVRLADEGGCYAQSKEAEIEANDWVKRFRTMGRRVVLA